MHGTLSKSFSKILPTLLNFKCVLGSVEILAIRLIFNIFTLPFKIKAINIINNYNGFKIKKSES